MRKEASLPVRLDTDLNRRLNRAAKRLGLTKSVLIRIMVKSFVDQLEANGGKITFPLRWQDQNPDTSASPQRYAAEPTAQYGPKDGKR
ncbi:MAG: ribbon-helix-helix domain-containing protein [Kiritimatiellae bacterium]|jgi:antitoxin component of RelBE/YafQ-DinJ toxin-antitoxin module|nr:ribbon-helix-helix domain-containing protein [Kiritimatiellia bacterium]